MPIFTLKVFWFCWCGRSSIWPIFCNWAEMKLTTLSCITIELSLVGFSSDNKMSPLHFSKLSSPGNRIGISYSSQILLINSADHFLTSKSTDFTLLFLNLFFCSFSGCLIDETVFSMSSSNSRCKLVDSCMNLNAECSLHKDALVHNYCISSHSLSQLHKPRDKLFFLVWWSQANVECLVFPVNKI